MAKLNHIVIYFIGLSLFSIYSCKESDKDKIYRLTHEWTNKEIKFPNKMVFTEFLSDTINYQIPDSSYKIVIYVDSIGCISCKLQLNKWKEFITYIDSLSNKKVSFLFIFQPQDQDLIRYALKSDNFKLPVYIDTNKEFASLNHIPRDRNFQTFLTDRNNRIISIGNPVQNPQIRDLYLKKMFGISPVKHHLTDIKADSTEIDLGRINLGETKLYSIRIQNVGKHTFHLKDIITSCDCIKASCNWDTISSNNQSDIQISFTPQESGEFIQAITIYGNTKNKLLDINFKGFTN